MSRIAEIIAQVEKGEPVDIRRVLQLQSLDAALRDEQYAAEWLQREKDADDDLQQLVNK